MAALTRQQIYCVTELCDPVGNPLSFHSGSRGFKSWTRDRRFCLNTSWFSSVHVVVIWYYLKLRLLISKLLWNDYSVSHDCGLEDSRFEFRQRQEVFLYFISFRAVPEFTHPSDKSVRRFFPRGWNVRGVMLTTHFYQVPKLRISRAIILLPLLLPWSGGEDLYLYRYLFVLFVELCSPTNWRLCYIKSK